MVAETQTIQTGDSVNSEEPIDWTHLAKYTLGNKKVEQEVLELFTRQSSQYLTKLKNAKDTQTWREAAHTIKGSARGIGAWKIANKAEALEMLGEEAFGSVGRTAISGLEQNITEVIHYIDKVLGES